MNNFKALRVHQVEKGTEYRFDTISINELSEGEVVLKVAYSSINYKDALAITGKGKIMRKFPLVAGIDVAGTVVSSSDNRYQEGDEVLVVGCGIGENFDGGYAEYARVSANSIVKLPTGLTLRESMAIGTAGFTAALAIQRMVDNGQTPEMGEVLVTGSTGGVGSLAIRMLNKAGFDAVALTRKAEQKDYLIGLGASRILLADEVDLGKRPLERAEWGGAIDNLGGDTLTWLTRTVKPWGNIGSIGLASSHKLDTTVMPFILRAVSLLGINSTEVPTALREKVWQRLATDLHPDVDAITNREVALDDLPAVMPDYIDSKVTGRTVVRIS